MNHGALVAIHAATAAAHARTKVLDAFRLHGATAPERAQPLGRLGLADGDPALTHFLTAGVVRSVDARSRPLVPGDSFGGEPVAYYLDEAVYVAERDGTGPAARQAQRRAWRVLGVLVLVVAAIALGIVVVLLSRADGAPAGSDPSAAESPEAP